MLRHRIDSEIIAMGGEPLCEETARVPTIAAYRMPGRSANAQLIRFDAKGIAVSAGSACSSGSLRTSHVMEAIGYPHAAEVIRVSLGSETTPEEVERFLAVWAEVAR